MSDNLFENNNETEAEMLEVVPQQQSAAGSYTDDSIQTLSWN